MLKKHIANVERASTGRQRLGAVQVADGSAASRGGWRSAAWVSTRWPTAARQRGVAGTGRRRRASMARRHGRMPWRHMRGRRRAGAPAEAGACRGGACTGSGAQAAGGGVGTESEWKGEEREEEEARFVCEFNSCDWLHESQILEDWREKKTFARYIGLAPPPCSPYLKFCTGPIQILRSVGISQCGIAKRKAKS